MEVTFHSGVALPLAPRRETRVGGGLAEGGRRLTLTRVGHREPERVPVAGVGLVRPADGGATEGVARDLDDGGPTRESTPPSRLTSEAGGVGS